MEKSIKIPFSSFYESDAKGSYLVLELNMKDEIHDYQVEMMLNNDIHPLLSLDLRHKDANKYLYYNITSKIQLKQLIARKKLKKSELIQILIETVQGVLQGGNYLLHHDNFVIDEDYLFIHPESLQVSLLYVPSLSKVGSIVFALQQLVNRLIGSVELQQDTGDHFLLKILCDLNKETFNLKEFLSFLRDLKTKEIKGEYITNKRQELEDSIVNSTQYNDFFTEKQEFKGSNEDFKKEKIKEIINDKKAIIKKENNKREEINPSTGEVKYQYSSKTKLMILLSEIIIFIVVALLFLETTILINTVTGKIDAVSVMGLVLLVGVINLLILKKLLVKENLEPVSNNRSSLIMNKREIINIPKEMPLSVNHHQQRPSKRDEKVEESFDTEILEIDYTSPQLISLHGGLMEKILIAKKQFVIGKLKEQVDYVILNKTISRVHAEIQYKDGNYYIKDLNSRNGTYLNGVQINSNIDYILKDEDRIAFADKEYLFSMQQKNGVD